MTRFPLQEFRDIATPFYFYDLNLLDRTLSEIKRTARDDVSGCIMPSRPTPTPAYCAAYRLRVWVSMR